MLDSVIFSESLSFSIRLFEFQKARREKSSMYEAERLYLKHPDFSDWEPMLCNVWSHEETARYMLWSVTVNAEAAQERMRRTIDYQRDHTAWLVYERESGEPIGFAGFCRIDEGVFEDTGIALGPRFVGKGYGREILNLLTRIAKTQYCAVRFVASCRSQNQASRKMILGCGFQFTHQEDRTDPRNGIPYILEFYEKKL